MRLLLLCLAILSLNACATDKGFYYRPSADVSFNLENVQRLKGEQCYFEEPKNALITNFFDNILLEAALVTSIAYEIEGKVKSQSTILLVWIWSQKPIRFADNQLMISLNNKSPYFETMAVQLGRDERVRSRDKQSLQQKRRPHLRGENQLALAEAFVNLNIVAPQKVAVELPTLLVEGKNIKLPMLTFVKESGKPLGALCTL